MNEDRISGMADKATGSVKSAVGNATGDTKLQAEGAADKIAGAARNAAGSARDAISDAADTVSEKASELSRDAGPLLDQVGRKARNAVAAGTEEASQLLRGYPLVTMGLIAAVAFLVGRVTAAEPRPWYRRDWR